MKLIVVVVQDKDAGRLVDALVRKGHQTTKLASTGGFLREGNTTMLIGVPEDELDDAIGIIEKTCHSRTQMISPVAPSPGAADGYVPYPVEVLVGGATIFVVDVEEFKKV